MPKTTANGTAAARQWTAENLHPPLTLAGLAGHSPMSLRIFACRFNEEVGISPGGWLIQQRVARARHLRESTDLGVDEITGQVGFATGTSLREHLHAAIGVSPLAYRRTFRGSCHGAADLMLRPPRPAPPGRQMSSICRMKASLIALNLPLCEHVTASA